MDSPSPPAPNHSLGPTGKNSAVALTAAGKNIELGKYRITRMLGQGGFGITYLAQHMETEQDVVIKENLPTDFMFRDSYTLQVVAMNDELEADCRWAMDNFLHEARLLMKLDYPNIVKVQDAFTALGTVYYVMPWVGGSELGQAAPAPGEITETWLAPILRQLLEALQYLHGKNILHRDIKPSNILMSEGGAPVLIDFGAARAIISEKSATKVGTPGYTPIEQVQSKGKRGPWTDLYALGATCYRLITGKRPPRCEDRMGKRDCYRPLAPQAELYSHFNRQFLEAIDKALAVWGKDRWQSAQEWLAALPAPKPAEPTPAPIAVPTTATLTSHDNCSLTEPAKKGNAKLLRMLRMLRSAKANDNWEDATNETPLYTAAKEGDTEAVRYLLTDPGIDVNRADEDGWTPLFAATIQGHTEVVRLLLAAPGIDVNRADEDGWTPLFAATIQDHTEVVGLLLAAPGIDVNRVDVDGRTPLILAARTGHTEVVRLLLAAPGIDVDKACQESQWTRLHLAASVGFTDMVRQQLAVGADVNKADEDGCSPLFLAARMGHTEVVKLLLAAPGIDINKVNKYGQTPLFLAAWDGHTEIVKQLLAAPGIDVDKTCQRRKWTRLHLAASAGYTDMVRQQLNAGAYVNMVDEDGWTPLLLAADSGHTEVVQLLLQLPGLDVNKAGPFKRIHQTVKFPGTNFDYAKLELIWFLLREAESIGLTDTIRQQFADVFEIHEGTTSGYTPLHIAVMNNRTEVVRRLLLAPGINVNRANEDGETPLDMAKTDEIKSLLRAAGGKTKGKILFFKLLFAALLLIFLGGGWYVYHSPRQQAVISLFFRGINSSNYDRKLNKAASEGDAELTQLLITAGADVNKAIAEGYTPLHLAAYNNRTEVIRLLLAAPDIEVNKADEWHTTPLDRARTHEIKSLLREAGGKTGTELGLR